MKKTTKIFAVMTAAACMGLFPAYGNGPAVLSAYAAESGWTMEGDSQVYYDEDGYLVTDSWRKNGEDWFYLDEDGQIAVSRKIDDYYVGADGKMVKNSWIELRNEEDLDSPDMPASKRGDASYRLLSGIKRLFLQHAQCLIIHGITSYFFIPSISKSLG